VPLVCPHCGNATAEDARFCSSCGTSLDADPRPAAEPFEERRIVSILFADLADFTSHSDRADPEDVRRTLVPFHALAKEEIERFGGTLDKFIGDAAMGVFGAPIAHEDDAERALRAAFAIQSRVDELELSVRIAVNTGEAVVAFATGPAIGENVAGDVVNTASRLQSLAPIGCIVVGESTYRATRGSVEFVELAPAVVKGKTEALAVWRAAGLRSDAPLRDEDDPPPFVGRERERALLRELFARTVGGRSVQFVTIVGDPGIGKSRLVADLAEHLRSSGERVSWLRGRCLPYGEAITFAPLEEVARAATGIKRSDDLETAAGKLSETVHQLAETPDEGDWLRARLAPLLGVAEGMDGTAVSRSESFAAWSRFIERLATESPHVLVIEDLHWADPAMLEFLDQLSEHLSASPLLLVCTTRPELFDRRSEWGVGKANSTTISLSPLGDAEMQTLLGGLLVRTLLPPESQSPLLASAGGNPLFALEFVRMLGDRWVEGGARDKTPDDGGTIRVPESIQALIAARLDVLPPAQRSLLQDAAVVGDPFWSGALESMTSLEAGVQGSLRELERRGLIRRPATRSMEGQLEFAFSHALIRDVAYGQIPRAGRARRHLSAARWLEETAGDRLEDRAEQLALHTTEALALTRAAHLPEDIPALEDDGRRFLLLAGDRQAPLDAERAATYYARALELTPPGHPRRPDVLRRATLMGWRAGKMQMEDAVRAYEEATEGALAAGDRTTAAQAMRRLYFQLGLRGDTAAAREVLDRAIELLEPEEPSEMLAELYACRAEDSMFAGRSKDSIEWADRALALPHTISTALMALHIRGNGRCEVGDLGGMDDLWEALRQAEAAGTGLDISASYSYLSEWVGLFEGPRRALELNEASIQTCERRGIRGQAWWSRAESLWMLYDLGQWDRGLSLIDELIPWATEHGDAQIEAVAFTYRARMLVHRGRTDEAADSVARSLPLARRIGDLQVLAPTLVCAASVEHARGSNRTALEALHEFDEVTADGPTEYREILFPEAIRACLATGDVELATAMLGDRPVYSPRAEAAVRTARALLAEAGGNDSRAAALFEEAADSWEKYEGIVEHAHALAGLARCLDRLGRTDESDGFTRRSGEIFDRLGVPA
jgi:class 3 adenylate cyclase/tetratricopeptide (TPR) repeat protein